MNALILVDIQNDFLPGGALPVPRGDEIIPVVNRLQEEFPLVVATQDWHPADHGSFAANHAGRRPGEVIDLHGLPQILWPVHCVQHSHGAAFAPGLRTERIAQIFFKGTDPQVDSYSGIFDNGRRKATGLADYLRGRGVTEVTIAGLATDYCVKATALDAQALGFKTTVVTDACRGVDLTPGDSARAFAEMERAGIHLGVAPAVRIVT
ncbi:MAG: bifunctional nicotinamidase/pyrazinamidase [Lacunisphaera sp.]